MLIDEKLIKLNVEAGGKEEVIRELALFAAREGKITSEEDYIQSVMEREQSCTTGIGNGIAIPHGKSKGVKEATIVFGRVPKGVEWNAMDGNPVEMIFLLGIPEDNVDNLHLKVLSQLARKIMDDDFTASLRSAKSVQEVMTILSCISI
jgi:PTS system fructose-specific IIA component